MEGGRGGESLKRTARTVLTHNALPHNNMHVTKPSPQYFHHFYHTDMTKHTTSIHIIKLPKPEVSQSH